MKLGDFVKGMTDALGIKQCEKCKKRQEKLNELHRKMFPTKRRAPKR